MGLSKPTENTGGTKPVAHNDTVFAQVLKLVPRHEFESLARKHKSGRMSRSMTRWGQFVAMGMAQLTGRCSLSREEVAHHDLEDTRRRVSVRKSRLRSLRRGTSAVIDYVDRVYVEAAPRSPGGDVERSTVPRPRGRPRTVDAQALGGKVRAWLADHPSASWPETAAAVGVSPGGNGMSRLAARAAYQAARGVR